MRRVRFYGLLIILTVLVIITSVSLLACTPADGGQNENEIVKIRIGEFKNTEVYYGDKLNLDEATILATTRGNNVHTIGITEDMISGYDYHKLGEQEITVTYEGCSAKLKIFVRTTEVQGISINSKPSVVSVVQGGELSLSGISLKVDYQTRSIIIDNVTKAMLSGYDTSLPVGTHTVYIEYAGFVAPLEIEVLSKSVLSLEIDTLPSDRQYFIGERLDPAGLVIKRNYDNGSVDTIAYNDEATAFGFDYDFSRENAYSVVTVTVNGMRVSFTCTVSKPVVTGFTIDVYPITRAIVHNGVELNPSTDILHIVEGAEIDWSTGSGTVYYDNGETVNVALSDSSVYPFYNSIGGDYLTKDHEYEEVGEHILQVRYGNSDVYAAMHITVRAKSPFELLLSDKRGYSDDGLTFIESQTFVEGNLFSTSFLVYNILYDNGTYRYPISDVTEWGSIDESMLSDDGSTFLLSTANLAEDGKQYVNFTVSGISAGYKITVVPKTATAIKVQEPYRNVYLAGSELDLTGSYVYVQYNDNSFERISPIPDSAVIVKDDEGNVVSTLSTEGVYTVEVSLAGGSSSFEVTAVSSENYVSKVTIEGMSQEVTYNYPSFDDIPVNVLKMNVIRGGEPQSVALSEAEMLVFNRYASGVQDISFRYEGCVFVLRVNIEGRRVSSIEVSKAPSKLVYILGTDTELDTEGLLITKLFNDGDRGEQSYFDGLWSFSGYDLSVAGEQSVKVSYDLGDRVFNTSFTIEVADVRVSSISFDDSQPGVEAFKITSGESEETFRGIMVTYRDDVNLTYIYEYVDDKGIWVTEIRTLMITVTYENGFVTERELKASYLSYDKNVNPNVEGDFKQTAQISYGGKTAMMNLYVVGRKLAEVSVYSTPNVLTYAEGQSLNNAGGYILRTYDDGTTDILPMTSGLIATEGYSVYPFAGVQGGTYIDQTVTLSYGQKTTSFVVRTYRKLIAEPILGNSIFSYGDTREPVVTIRESITGFTIPDTEIEYLIDGSWVEERPAYPGTYAIRIKVIGNEYYENDVYEGDNFNLIVKKKAIIVNIEELRKVYGEADPDYVYSIDKGELVGDDVVEIELSREEGDDVKYVVSGGQRQISSYLITAKLTAGGANNNAFYEIAYKQVGLTIMPKTVTVNSLGNDIDVDFTTPNNYNSITNSIKYTGQPIQAFSAKYTDARGYTIFIDEKDIIYLDKDGNELVEYIDGVAHKVLPKEQGTYTVKISDNYSFTGKYSRTFSID